FSKIYVVEDRSASLVEITDQLGDPPFGRFHRCLAISFSIVLFWIIGRRSIALRNCSVTRQLLLFTADLILSFRAQHTRTKGEDKTFCCLCSSLLTNSSSAVQKGCLKQCYTRINHKCTQQNLTYYARIKCALKVSSCGILLSKNLELTILPSNGSSSSTIVFKFPHTKNDSIFTQWFTI
ncbi:hypothetical protein H5410_021406, partial [Solanum commersonii]